MYLQFIKSEVRTTHNALCALPSLSFYWLHFLYSSFVTGSHHSVLAPSAGTAMAMCWNQLSEAAPCQCFTSAGMFTTSPGLSARAGSPHSWYQPRPPTQMRICPPLWCMCQLLRQCLLDLVDGQPAVQSIANGLCQSVNISFGFQTSYCHHVLPF